MSDPAKKTQDSGSCTERTSFDAKSLLVNNDFEECYLITPYGHKIHLSINNRVPYFSDSSVKPVEEDSSDLVSEPDFELAVSDPSDALNVDVAPAAPAAHRITKKSKIELTDHQQTLLDHAVSRQILKSIDTHDILHLYSHKDCALCREVKQRRHYTHPVPIEKQNRVNKPFWKTDIDHIIMGDNVPGIHGETVGLVARDEDLGWVSFHGSKHKNANEVAEGLRHHFGAELNRARSRGLLFIVIQLQNLKRYARS